MDRSTVRKARQGSRSVRPFRKKEAVPDGKEWTPLPSYNGPPMKTVAISTSSDTGSAALREDGRVLAEREFPSGILHGQALLPALQGLFSDAGWSRTGFDVVGVDIGPGSYTGCRIGIAAAKILARETKAALVGVPSLAAIALSAAGGQAATVAAALDARRGRLYAALYRVDGAAPDPAVPLIPPSVETARVWTAAVKGQAGLWAGNALAVHPDLFAGFSRAPESTWKPRAGSVAALAEARLSRGERDDPYLLEPLYLALTEAEERFGTVASPARAR